MISCSRHASQFQKAGYSCPRGVYRSQISQGKETLLFIQDLIRPRGAKDSLMKQYLAQFLKLGS